MTTPSRKSLLAAVLALAALYVAAVLYMGGLSFDPIKDEEQFWAQVVSFANDWPPSVAQLQNYQEPMTPVSFLIGAWIESTFGLGIAGGRLVSFFASLGVLVLIIRRRVAPGMDPNIPLLAAVGLFAYPYWLPMSLLVYTDTLAALFVVLGFWSYAREKHIAGFAFFVVAIATRQYMIAFPAAIIAYEGLAALRARNASWSRWLPYAAAGLSLLGWFAFFGGVGPADGLQKWPRHSNSLESADPAFSLYFLSAMGIYYVLPEFAIDRGWRTIEFKFNRYVGLALVVLAVAFVLFAPNYTEGVGPFNRTLYFVLGEGAFGEFARLSVLYVLACLTLVRFAHLDLGTWLVAVNFVLMAFLWTPWEKYCLQVLAALWFLKAAGAFDLRGLDVHAVAFDGGERSTATYST